ncbi:Uncharacterised protein [Burkholderia cepacia]|uniref:Uncharacterized protein n=1 Tax=Burkholderia cepacia TaxID=292 RepID=A0AAE8NM82_BURCE|nr:hypothetical protein CSX04_04942 [Burkholderia cepacia]SQA61436.1 Uncharacterised protein [Burkholderia cepacia]
MESCRARERGERRGMPGDWWGRLKGPRSTTIVACDIRIVAGG